MSEKDLGEIAKGFEESMKAYLNALFERFTKHIEMYLVRRNVHLVSEKESIAGVADIYTGLKEVSGHIIQIYRRGTIVANDAFVNSRGTMLRVESGEDHYRLITGDKICWIAW